MFRHIYNWNIVACDVKQQISISIFSLVQRFTIVLNIELCGTYEYIFKDFKILDVNKSFFVASQSKVPYNKFDMDILVNTINVLFLLVFQVFLVLVILNYQEKNYIYVLTLYKLRFCKVAIMHINI